MDRNDEDALLDSLRTGQMPGTYGDGDEPFPAWLLWNLIAAVIVQLRRGKARERFLASATLQLIGDLRHELNRSTVTASERKLSGLTPEQGRLHGWLAARVHEFVCLNITAAMNQSPDVGELQEIVEDIVTIDWDFREFMRRTPKPADDQWSAKIRDEWLVLNYGRAVALPGYLLEQVRKGRAAHTKALHLVAAAHRLDVANLRRRLDRLRKRGGLNIAHVPLLDRLALLQRRTIRSAKATGEIVPYTPLPDDRWAIPDAWVNSHRRGSLGGSSSLRRSAEPR
jgi:hypothetical protein